MKVRSITFDDAEEICPASVTVEMTITEVVYLARILGGMNGIQQEAVIRGGASLEIYDALVGDVINRYWEDGTPEAMRYLGVVPAVSPEDGGRTDG